MPDIIEKLTDLRLQATTEKSHFCTAKIIEEAMMEIIILREKVNFLEDLCKKLCLK